MYIFVRETKTKTKSQMADKNNTGIKSYVFIHNLLASNMIQDELI